MKRWKTKNRVEWLFFGPQWPTRRRPTTMATLRSRSTWQAARWVHRRRRVVFFPFPFQIEITRDDNVRVGGLLDHHPGGETVSLERMWLLLRLILGTFFFVTGLGMLAVSIVEWTTATHQCAQPPLRMWLLIESIAQIVCVPVSLLSRMVMARAGRARGCGAVSLALAARVVNLFMFSWFVVGMVWMVAAFSSTLQCSTELPLTWHVMLVILVAEIVALSVATACLIFSCITVVARMLIMSNGGQFREAGRRGASAEEITEHSDVRPFRAQDFPDAEDAKCVVCLGEYEEGDQLRYLRCNHHFHIECVDEWLKRQGSCPLCVRELGAQQPAAAAAAAADAPAAL